VNQANLELLAQYILTIEKELVAGNATEHTHRPALKTLIEGLAKSIVATNEPQRIECGAPDFLVTKGAFQVGYMEAKDVGKSLDEAEKSEQLRRYRGSLPNIILTDYLEFRWYVDGELRCPSACLGTPTKEGKIKRYKAGAQAVAELLNEFLAHEAEAVGTPKELAKRMARLAHRLRELVTAAFQKKLNLPSLSNLYKAFCDTLVPDLTTEQFADMYAQTIAYGLFAARCNSPNGKMFTRQYARDMVPKTNPFLRNIFDHIAGAGLPEIITPEADDLTQLLAQADMAAVLKDFGKRTAKEDPVVHFYETFLAEYDPKVREMRGVYYTPEPVVSYIVRSIDHLLKTRFNKPQGLADDKTLILDPAVGTATFLYVVINEIHEAMLSQKQKGMWNDYVAEKLLPRLFGFELLMAPYAVAHLKLGLLLQETGYQFKSDQRLGIYLTNTLEEAIKHSEVLFAQWISEEANAAAQIKKEKPIMVVLGNPPYSVSSVNKGEYIEKIMERYKTAVRAERNIQPLSDDYIKFIRFAHDRIERTGYGIIGMITNHTYLSGLIHRGMREELIKSFSTIYLLDLHGSSLIGEKTPSGGKDENVFDIMQGVAIALYIKEPSTTRLAKVYHADVWGTREEKYKLLLETDVASTTWTELQVEGPNYFFVPRKVEHLQEYQNAWSLGDIFTQKATGFVTGDDHWLIAFDRQRVADVISSLASQEISDEEIEDRFGIHDVSGWPVSQRRKALVSEGFDKGKVRVVSYRPFDNRFCYYHSFLQRAREELMIHLLRDNVALLSTRMIKGEVPNHFFVSDSPVEKIFLSPKTSNNAFVFPLYVYPAEGEMQFEEGRRANLNSEFTKAVSEKLEVKFVSDGKGDLTETFGPEDAFNYAYAVFHSPTYRSRYAEFLKIDFPRLPLTLDKGLFKALADRGADLISLHLTEAPVLEQQRTQIKFDVSGSNIVEKVTYNETKGWVYINKKQYFEGVPPEVWNFHIGGYQVCHKWLKDKKGRTLSYDELTHYQKVVVALKETNRIMAEIDALIPGWPIE
jgi:predicted helicase